MNEGHDSKGGEIAASPRGELGQRAASFIERGLRDIARFSESQQTSQRRSSFINEMRNCEAILRDGGAEICREILKFNSPQRLQDRAIQLGKIMSEIANNIANEEAELNNILQIDSDLELKRLNIEQMQIIVDPLIELAEAFHAEDTPDCEKAKKLITEWCSRVLDGLKHTLAAVATEKN